MSLTGSGNALADVIVDAIENLEVYDQDGNKAAYKDAFPDNAGAHEKLVEHWTVVADAIVAHIVSEATVQISASMVDFKSALSGATTIPQDGGVALKSSLTSSSWFTKTYTKDLD